MEILSFMIIVDFNPMHGRVMGVGGDSLDTQMLDCLATLYMQPPSDCPIMSSA